MPAGWRVNYENLPIKYTDNFSAVKNENSIRKLLIFLIFLLKTLIVGLPIYVLENKKKYLPIYPSFTVKVGGQGDIHFIMDIFF